MAIRRIQVKMPGQTYEIRLGRGTISKLGLHLREIDEAKKAVIISDENLQSVYGLAVSRELTSVGYETHDLTLPIVDNPKSLGYINEIYENMALHGIGVDDLVVAVGGATVIEMAAFVAATYRGGVKLVVCPTSFNAMCDQTVNGRAFLDLSSGKNLVGVTKYPFYIAADINTMNTLPQENWIDGTAQIAKMCIMSSQKNFDWLQDACEPIMNRDPETVQGAIARSIEWKAKVLAESFKAKDPELLRALEYGSTFARALEALSDEPLSHGQCLAEGMRFAARLSVEMLGTPASFVQKQDAFLDALGLEPVAFNATPAMLYDALRIENMGGRRGATKFVLPKNGAGSWEEVPIPRKTLMAHLNAWSTVKEYLLEALAEVEAAEREAAEAQQTLESAQADRVKDGLSIALETLNGEYHPDIPDDPDYVPASPLDDDLFSDDEEDWDDEADDAEANGAETDDADADEDAEASKDE